MNNAIAVMNTKGGVGKSTIVLGLAETLAAYNGKSVLVIDSDAQSSISSMLMSTTQLHQLQSAGLTLVDYLVATVLNNQSVALSPYLVAGISDVDDARSVTLFPSDVQLTLFEREVSHEQRHIQLRTVIGKLLAEVRPLYDIVLIDCPPGLSVLTESWLREADYHLTPTKPDYISSCGLELFRRFKALNPEMGFAENLGVIINMKDRMSPADDEYHKWLAKEPENRCFDMIIPRTGSLQDAARFSPDERSYPAKYPGDSGRQMRALVTEILRRLSDATTETTAETTAQATTAAAAPSLSAEPEAEPEAEPAAPAAPAPTSAAMTPEPHAGAPAAASPEIITIGPEAPPINLPPYSAKSPQPDP